MITRLTHFITVKEYAARHKVKLRTVHDRIRRKEVGFTEIGGNANKLIFDRDAWNKIKEEDRPDVHLGRLKWVSHFAKAHKYSPDTIYQHIIIGNINAVVVANLVLIDPEEESVVTFLKNHPPIKRK